MTTGAGPVAVVTGATSGIGRALAEALAANGATVGIVARDAERCQATRSAIVEATGNEKVDVLVGDLSSLVSVRLLARDAAAKYAAIDVLVHCAGIYTRQRIVTTDGLETMFATNVLGPFLMTNLLLEQLRDAPAARVLVISAPSSTRLDFDDLQGERRFRSLSAFGASKAADLLFTFELARRFEGSPMTANAVHPGLTRTSLMREAAAPLRWGLRAVSRSPESAAKAIVPLALAREFAGRNGKFFHNGREIDPPTSTRDLDTARRLWEVCAGLSGLPAG
jgi:NAD(P)-dependent dehydrogenase (short-subunit alcohol dehydrogenase family)